MKFQIRNEHLSRRAQGQTTNKLRNDKIGVLGAKRKREGTEKQLKGIDMSFV